MSALGWQDLLVAVAVIVAVAYLVRRRRPKPVKSPLVSLGRATKRGAGAAPNG
ncbi:MAG: hypothetical protein FJ363_00785 [Gemmatimonadetes bacterium]|nr:hypothetical protein [Gemmatimonadota bacterium]